MRTFRAVGSAALALTFALPVLGQSSREKQSEKNLMRNVGIGLGAAAAHELVKGRTKNAALLGAGAALAGKRYEDVRKDQASDRRERRKRKSYRGKGRRYGHAHSRSRHRD